MFKRNRTDVNYELYRAQQNVCTSLRRKAIKQYFKRKSEEINQNPHKFWNTYLFLHSKCSIKANDIILKEFEHVITDKRRISTIFNDYFKNIANHIPVPMGDTYGNDFENDPSIEAIIRNKRSNTVGFNSTNIEVVQQLLQDININKSSGHNSITPKLVKLSATAIAAPITSIFNSAIIKCKYPRQWKKGQITPVLKNSEDDMNKKFYRPVVTVLPALNNVFERLLATQMQNYFERRLSDYLSAYRKNHSCQTSLLCLVEEWKKCLDNRDLVGIVSMDLSKAFDSLPHSLLIVKLRAYGLGDQSCLLILDYLCD